MVNKAKGRPSKYSEQLADFICLKVATNTVGVPKLCEMFEELPAPSTFHEWMCKYPEFSRKYAQAKIKQAELLAEKTLEIASRREYVIDKDGNSHVDSGAVAANRLEIDTLKWHASKLLPKTYGNLAREVVRDKLSVIDEIINKLI